MWFSWTPGVPGWLECFGFFFILGLGLEGERTRKGMEDCTRLIAYVILIINNSCCHSNQTQREWEGGMKEGTQAESHQKREVRHSREQTCRGMETELKTCWQDIEGRNANTVLEMKPSIFVLIIKHCGYSELSQSPLNEQPTVLLTHSRDTNAATQSSQRVHIYILVFDVARAFTLMHWGTEYACTHT